MTKDQCAKMCDSLKCTPEQKEACLSHYDANGKFVATTGKEGEGKSCCAKDEKNVKVEMTNENGKAKATVTTTEKGKASTQTFEGSLEEVKAKLGALK
jgi:K(+)-stimulated pyrophosphate-energized sodium pump